MNKKEKELGLETFVPAGHGMIVCLNETGDYVAKDNYDLLKSRNVMLERWLKSFVSKIGRFDDFKGLRGYPYINAKKYLEGSE